MSTKSWAPEAVAQWLATIEMSQYTANFLENDIDGGALLTLTATELKDDLEVAKLGHRKRILNNIEELRFAESAAIVDPPAASNPPRQDHQPPPPPPDTTGMLSDQVGAPQTPQASAPEQSVIAILQKIIDAQNGCDRATSYDTALVEISSGHKVGHWIWYVWPALQELRANTSRPEFLLPDIAAAQLYLRHPVLSPRLETITAAATQHLRGGVNAEFLFGSRVDVEKFRECMTVHIPHNYLQQQH